MCIGVGLDTDDMRLDEICEDPLEDKWIEYADVVKGSIEVGESILLAKKHKDREDVDLTQEAQEVLDEADKIIDYQTIRELRSRNRELKEALVAISRILVSLHER